MWHCALTNLGRLFTISWRLFCFGCDYFALNILPGWLIYKRAKQRLWTKAWMCKEWSWNVDNTKIVFIFDVPKAVKKNNDDGLAEKSSPVYIFIGINSIGNSCHSTQSIGYSIRYTRRKTNFQHVLFFWGTSWNIKMLLPISSMMIFFLLLRNIHTQEKHHEFDIKTIDSFVYIAYFVLMLFQ